MSDTITISTTEYNDLQKAKTELQETKRITDALSVIRHDEAKGVVYANNTVPFTSLVTNATRYNRKTEKDENFTRLTMTTDISKLQKFIDHVTSNDCLIKGSNQISFNTVLWTNAGTEKSPKYVTLQIDDNAYMGELSCSTKRYAMA